MEKNQLTEKKLNEQESLELITRMIRNTQNKLERNAGLPFLAWGYATVLATIAVGTMVYLTRSPYWNFLWFFIPAIGSLVTLKGRKQQKEVRTYVDDVVLYIWMVLGIVGFLLSVIAIFPPFHGKFPILFIIPLIMGIGTMLTGLVIKFRPCVIGGALGIVLSVAELFVPQGSIYMPVFFVLAFVVMMIVPGHILNHQVRKTDV